MLEALVSLRRRRGGNRAIGQRDSIREKRGDIICVKISPCVWGRKERKRFLIVKLRDVTLEADMVASDSTVRVFPYAKYTDTQLVNRSTRQVDIAEFTGTDALDPDIEVGAVDRQGKERLTKADLLFDDNERSR